ncbi:MAG: hypothetical protein K9N49_03070 [Candidatus Marinimicrobia bacterium]|nr:hypothetical protein [Candidatus Neomarinimicrobiota bacterium]
MALKIGWGQCSITPNRPVMMAGQFYTRISEKVQNPVTATVMAIESEGAGQSDRLLLISCDLVAISDSMRTAARQAISRMLPCIQPENIVLNATHTHTAPDVRVREDMNSPGGGNGPSPEEILKLLDEPIMTPAEYIAFAAENIALASREAWDARTPCGIGYGLGQALVGRNRRACYLSGECRMYGKTGDPTFSHIEGDEDHGVNVLAVWNRERELTGVIVNVACPAQDTEHLFEISADFWHETRVMLRQRLGPDIFILPQCSAAGDQSPHALLNKAAEERMLRLQRRTNREEIGERLAATVCAILPALETEIEWNPVFAHACETVQLVRRNLTEQDVADALVAAAPFRQAYNEELEHLAAHPEKKQEPRWYVAVTHAFRKVVWNESVESRFKRQQAQPHVSVELHLLRLGDVAIATNPFEYYLDFGQRIKARSPAIQTFLVQLAGSGTYLPTFRAIQGKSYGAVAASTPVGPEGGQEIVEWTLKQLGEMFTAE